LRFTPQFLRAWHLELFTKPSFEQLFTGSSTNEVEIFGIAGPRAEFERTLPFFLKDIPPKKSFPLFRRRRDMNFDLTEE
jgi:hypothetical protein